MLSVYRCVQTQEEFVLALSEGQAPAIGANAADTVASYVAILRPIFEADMQEIVDHEGSPEYFAGEAIYDAHVAELQAWLSARSNCTIVTVQVPTNGRAWARQTI